LNDDNLILLENGGDIGIIDFGDIDVGPRIGDFAILCTYLICHSRTITLDKVMDIISVTYRGYRCGVLEDISDAEITAIPILIICRSLMSTCIQTRNSKLHPENADYLQCSLRGNLNLLELVDNVGVSEFSSAISRRLG